MTEREALLAAILATPEDDLPRLVYADWCDEHGETERAEFIRVQVELDAAGHRRCFPRSGPEMCHLCVREREFLKSAVARSMVPNGVWINYFPDEAVGWSQACSAAGRFRRGFVAEIRCTLADWIGGECERCSSRRSAGGYVSQYRTFADCPACPGTGHIPGIGPAVVAAHPVQMVTTDKRTATGPNDSRCFTSTTNPRAEPGLFRLFHVLPPSLPLDWKSHGGFGGLIAEFDSDHAALSALSAACIEWAKTQPA